VAGPDIIRSLAGARGWGVNHAEADLSDPPFTPTRVFIAAGGGTWYTTTLGMLSPGDRVWVYIPGTGYVGVGEVQGAVTALDDFTVIDEAGNEAPLVSLPVKAASLTRVVDDPDKAEYLVPVNWIKTVPAAKAVKEKGFFGNQNTVARPTTAAWGYTVDRLKQRWGIE